jgi:hypothetical protein
MFSLAPVGNGFNQSLPTAPNDILYSYKLGYLQKV